ncbi:MAG: hypothetical protein ACJA0S_000832, partial [Rickettsiales bacterium]
MGIPAMRGATSVAFFKNNKLWIPAMRGATSVAFF